MTIAFAVILLIRVFLPLGLGLALPGAAAPLDAPYPVRGAAPPPEIGGPISIPGFPLPPPPEESVEDAIAIYEPMVELWRLVRGEAPSVARGLGYLAGLKAALGDEAAVNRLYAEALHELPAL